MRWQIIPLGGRSVSGGRAAGRGAFLARGNDVNVDRWNHTAYLATHSSTILVVLSHIAFVNNFRCAR